MGKALLDSDSLEKSRITDGCKVHLILHLKG
jgi:hypothetical protein